MTSHGVYTSFAHVDRPPVCWRDRQQTTFIEGQVRSARGHLHPASSASSIPGQLVYYSDLRQVTTPTRDDRDLRQLATPTRDDRDLRQLTTPTRDEKDLQQFQTTYTRNPKELRQSTTPTGQLQTTPLRNVREPRQLTPPIRHLPTTPSRDDCQPTTQSKPVFHIPQTRSHQSEFLTPSRDVTKPQSADPPRPMYVRIPAGPRSCPPCSPTTRISQDASPGKKAIYFEVDDKADNSTIIRKVEKLIEQVERQKGKYRDDTELVPVLALQNPPKRRIKRQLSSDSDSQSSASSSFNSSCTPDKVLVPKHAISSFPGDLVPSSGTTLTFSQKRLKSSPESNQPSAPGQLATFDNIQNTNKPTQARADNESLQHTSRVPSPLQQSRPRSNSNFRHRVRNSPSEIWPPPTSYDTHVFESPTTINSTSLIPVSPKTHRDERTVVKKNVDQHPTLSHTLSQVQNTSNVIKTTPQSNHRKESVILGNRYRNNEPQIFVFPDVNHNSGSKDDEVDGFDSPMDMDEDMDNSYSHSRSHFHENNYVNNSNGFHHIRHQTPHAFNSSAGSNYAQAWSRGSSQFNDGETSYGPRGHHRYHDNRMDDLDSGGIARHCRAEVSRTPRDNTTSLPAGLGEVFDASEPDDSPYDDGTGRSMYSGWNSGHNSGIVATRASTQVSCVITESELRRAAMTSRDDDNYLASDGYGDDYLPLPGWKREYDEWDEMDGPEVHSRHAQITPEMRLAKLQDGAGYHGTSQPNCKKVNVTRSMTTDGDLCSKQNRIEKFSQRNVTHLDNRVHNPVHRVLSTDRKRFKHKPEVNDTQRYTQEDGYTDLRDFENDWVSTTVEGGQLFYAKGRSPVNFSSHSADSGDEVDGFGDKSKPEPEPSTSSKSSNTVSCFGTSSNSSNMTSSSGTNSTSNTVSCFGTSSSSSNIATCSGSSSKSSNTVSCFGTSSNSSKDPDVVRCLERNPMTVNSTSVIRQPKATRNLTLGTPPSIHQTRADTPPSIHQTRADNATSPAHRQSIDYQLHYTHFSKGNNSEFDEDPLLNESSKPRKNHPQQSVFDFPSFQQNTIDLEGFHNRHGTSSVFEEILPNATELRAKMSNVKSAEKTQSQCVFSLDDTMSPKQNPMDHVTTPTSEASAENSAPNSARTRADVKHDVHRRASDAGIAVVCTNSNALPRTRSSPSKLGTEHPKEHRFHRPWMSPGSQHLVPATKNAETQNERLVKDQKHDLTCHHRVGSKIKQRTHLHTEPSHPADDDQTTSNIRDALGASADRPRKKIHRRLEFPCDEDLSPGEAPHTFCFPETSTPYSQSERVLQNSEQPMRSGVSSSECFKNLEDDIVSREKRAYAGAEQAGPSMLQTGTKRPRQDNEIDIKVNVSDVMQETKELGAKLEKIYQNTDRSCECGQVEQDVLGVAMEMFKKLCDEPYTGPNWHADLHQINLTIKDSLDIAQSLRHLCRHGRRVGDVLQGSVLIRVKCATLTSVVDLCAMAASGELQVVLWTVLCCDQIKFQRGFTLSVSLDATSVRHCSQFLLKTLSPSVKSTPKHRKKSLTSKKSGSAENLVTQIPSCHHRCFSTPVLNDYSPLMSPASAQCHAKRERKFSFGETARRAFQELNLSDTDTPTSPICITTNSHVPKHMRSPKLVTSPLSRTSPLTSPLPSPRKGKRCESIQEQENIIGDHVTL